MRSGLSERDFYSFTNSEIFYLGYYTVYTSTLFVPCGISSNDDVLKVKKLTFCELLTLLKAFPAYVGLTNVLLSIISITSVIGWLIYLPATLGIISLPILELTPIIFLYWYF